MNKQAHLKGTMISK